MSLHQGGMAFGCETEMITVKSGEVVIILKFTNILPSMAFGCETEMMTVKSGEVGIILKFTNIFG